MYMWVVIKTYKCTKYVLGVVCCRLVGELVSGWGWKFLGGRGRGSGVGGWAGETEICTFDKNVCTFDERDALLHVYDKQVCTFDKGLGLLTELHMHV
jgi:hypothetical protein